MNSINTNTLMFTPKIAHRLAKSLPQCYLDVIRQLQNDGPTKRDVSYVVNASSAMDKVFHRFIYGTIVIHILFYRADIYIFVD